MDAVPEKGSILTLISKSQVRYEGVLELIDMSPGDGSITLNDVAQYGTEDRPANAYIAPSNERFQSICFKGTDIVALDVKHYARAPPKQAAPQAPPPGPGPPPHLQQNAAMWGPPSSAPPQGSTWGPPQPPAQSAAPTSQQPTPAQYAQPSAPPAQPHSSWQSAAPAPTVVVTPSMASRPQTQPRQAPPQRQAGWSNAAAPPSRAPPPPQSAAANNQSQTPSAPPLGSSPDKLSGPPPGFSGPPPGFHGNKAPAQRSQPTPSANASAGPAPGRGGPEGGRGRGRGRRGGGPGRGAERNQGQGEQYQGGQQQPREGRAPAAPRAPPVPVPKEDFNFEEGLSKFDKGQVKNEADGGIEAVEDPVSTPTTYTKDDFFDTLSSDLSGLSTQERPQRIPFSEQRKVDMETFGGSGVARRPMRGRGRGRGGRGRGGRGRGGDQAQASPVIVL